MTDPPLEPIDVLHPLLGRRPPSIASLIERADSGAQRVLLAARRLYRRRATQQRILEAQVGTLDTADGLGLAPRLSTPTSGLAESDLLRALLAVEPERMAAPFGDDLRAKPFAELVERQTQALAGAPEPGDDDALEPGWARRWALADERHGAGPVTISLLMASLGIAGLSQLEPLSEIFVEGLITRYEVGLRLLGRVDDDVARRVFTPVPPAYLDRGEGLRALEEAFAASEGRVLLTGEPRSGRSALLRTWLEFGGHARPVRLDPHQGPTGVQSLPLEGPTLVGMTAPRMSARQAEEQRLRHGLILDPSELQPRREAWLVEHAEALARGGSIQAVLVIEPRERAILIARVPALAEFREVRLSAPDPLEQAMIWLAHTMPAPELDLARVLTAVHTLGSSVMATIDPWALADLVPAALQAHFDEAAALRSLSHRAITSLLKAHDRGEPKPAASARRMLRSVGGEAGLSALIELDERLYGPRPSRS